MALDKIVIKGAREHNLKNVDLELPRDNLLFLLDFPDPVSPLWLLTPFTLTVNAVMLKAFPPMRACF